MSAAHLTREARLSFSAKDLTPEQLAEINYNPFE